MNLLHRIYQEVDASASRADRTEGPARAALLVGVLLSATLLAAGLLVTLVAGELRPDRPPNMAELLRGIIAFRGVSLLYLGLLLLAATPILRVSVMIAIYLRRRERFMSSVSLLVLLLLILGLLLGTG